MEYQDPDTQQGLAGYFFWLFGSGRIVGVKKTGFQRKKKIIGKIERKLREISKMADLGKK